MKRDSANRITLFGLDRQRQHQLSEVSSAIKMVIEDGNFILGPQVRDLEDQLAEFASARYCVSCGNGTDALVLSLMAEEIGPGDAVIVPAFTFVASAEAIALRGATPVFADTEPDRFSLSASSAAEAIGLAIKSGLRPRAIISVDLFGLPADYASLQQLATDSGLLLVADAAQAFGAEFEGQRVGALADYTTTSFFPTKPLGGFGDGGAVFVESEQQARVLTSLRTHGSGAEKYEQIRVGLNSRLDSIQAAVLLAKLRYFDDELATRRHVAQLYSELLNPELLRPHDSSRANPSWGLFPIICSDEHRRSKVASNLAERGIESSVYYPRLISSQAPYSQLPATSLRHCSQLPSRILSIPIHGYLLDHEVEEIASIINRVHVA